jgi:hypothetical protein
VIHGGVELDLDTDGAQDTFEAVEGNIDDGHAFNQFAEGDHDDVSTQPELECAADKSRGVEERIDDEGHGE